VQELSPGILGGIPRNGPTDPIEFYKRPLVGWLFRERINLGLRMLGRSYQSALEVGYGAGAVQVALADGVRDLHGIDLDADPTLVEPILRQRGIEAHLQRGSVLELPYPDGRFDLVVCFSVIEHLHEYRRALVEMARVLGPEGRLLLGMPSVNRTMELGFRAIGFKGIQDHHVTTPEQVTAAFPECGLRVDRSAFLDLPRPAPLGVRLYHNWLLAKA
jgi:SAM-dependent methyltransferase